MMVLNDYFIQLNSIHLQMCPSLSLTPNPSNQLLFIFSMTKAALSIKLASKVYYLAIQTRITIKSPIKYSKDNPIESQNE